MKTFKQAVQEAATWLIDRVKGKIPDAHMSNPVPYKTFKTVINNQVNWCQNRFSFDQIAQAVKDELLKHNIKVAHGYARNDWNPDQILQQQQQQQSQPRSSGARWQQYNEQQFHGHLEQNDYSLTLLAHDGNNIIKLIAWIHDVLCKTSNHQNLKQICFSVDFKEVD